MITNGLIFPPFANKDKILLPVEGKYIKGIDAFSIVFDGQINTIETVNLLPDLGENKHYVITNGFARSKRDANNDNAFFELEAFNGNLKLFPVSANSFILNVRELGKQFDLLVFEVRNSIFCRLLNVHYSTENDSIFNIAIMGYVLTLNDL